MPRTVVIVDDHTAFRRSARTLLELEGFDVIGEAADGISGLAEVQRLRPEVVLLDIGLPDMSGFRVAEEIAGTSAVVLVSNRSQGDIGARLRRSGARGFIPKDELTGATLEAVLGGET
jgi:DNA-binding NarL/FixJ family response regulator